MPHRRFLHPFKIGGAFAAVLALAVVAGPAASAQAASTGSAAAKSSATSTIATTSYVTAPAKIIGFDAAIAKAHGYVIKKDAQGREYSVKASEAGLSQSALALQPQNEVTLSGNCGSSFMEYTAIGSKKATVYTGFSLVGSSAYYYDWDVAVTDSAGTGTEEFYDYLDSDWSWSTIWLTSHSVTGYSTARVVYGYAYQLDGGICYSELPAASTTLY
ncbi:hypothetical protein KDL01_10465 [Actinospica durhamensis]|uniref:Tat pathway signal sequence domain protein n=1 Tax=Actinospica durhamensis TaxID=1508375 RepID=A0A941ETQ0_9ACTN|nr:hypothetical protein [Actinospica durhamensis]MBR7833689.1 hypothetical protein [Actinospica durhamensis]